MPSSNQIAQITSAMGDAVRVNMLLALRFDGGLTASELARVGNVAPSTASEHLARMVAAGLIVQQKMGRQRLYALADAEVCDILDSVTALTEAMFAQGILAHGRARPRVTGAGANWFQALGIDHAAYEDRPRCALRLCRDWTEDSHHLGGGLASALLDTFRQRDWVRTRRGEMQVFVTPKGLSGLRDTVGLDLRRTDT